MLVIFLSELADVPKAVLAVKGGAIDFIEKPFDYKQIVELVCDCLTRDTAAREARARARFSSERLALLSHCEKEVLQRIVAGRLNREIVDELVISIKTVEVHLAHIKEKLDVRSVAQLAQIAMIRRRYIVAPHQGG